MATDARYDVGSSTLPPDVVRVRIGGRGEGRFDASTFDNTTSNTVTSPSLPARGIPTTVPSTLLLQNDDGVTRPKTSPSTPTSSPVLKSRWKRISTAAKRDSGLGTTASTVSNHDSFIPDDDGYASQSNIIVGNESSTSLPVLIEGSRASGSLRRGGPGDDSPQGLRISLDIPSGDLFGDDLLDRMSFSKRGSILLGGRRANQRRQGHIRLQSKAKRQSSSLLVPSASLDGARELSVDEKLLSQQVRSMYEHGNHLDAMAQTVKSPRSRDELPVPGQSAPTDVNTRNGTASRENASVPNSIGLTPERYGLQMAGTPTREETEAVEDWEDLDGRDVDRYGFIIARKMSSRGSNSTSHRPSRTSEPQRPQRVSTLLQLASETPRRNRGLVRKSSSPRVGHSTTPRLKKRDVSGSSTRTTPSSLNSDRSMPSRRLFNPLQYAASHLPGNRDKRFVLEASDMLTLPPGLANIAEDGKRTRTVPPLKEKEWERVEKWRKMAKVVTKGTNGRGMVFNFDVQDPKLISRTWKGIPDRWRATAWHSFLSNSAKKRKGCPTDEEIITRFHELLEQSSADDVQIDMDVPRTINRHVMFRRRYRGGQRLLFRLLHSLSLYFPSTGYVQGMASLAATLLCYYDEDTAFVMLVRMWQLRGLARLYQPGFRGLMEALEDFEQNWLGGRDVANRLVRSLLDVGLYATPSLTRFNYYLQHDLGIDATAYGTRWYLTLFNYSIPFPAQLRVWDVFMLLGDDDDATSSSSLPPPSSSSSSPPSSSTASETPERTTTSTTSITTTCFQANLDILHATSTALIDGLTDILLRSDFENAMKALTSWIPVLDEELLMKVTKAEWKRRRRGRS
ncbi:MAG: hypothetical protein M1816_000863 [Peltula sp. TS41687]|nr:MAG: hypothetical protein M1816_000863 [Peltula sp. TS41687]